jgi:methylglutaconyl-CoA hydratase
MTEINSGHIISEKHGSVMFIEFYHPQSNSLPLMLLNDLAAHIQKAGLDDAIQVIVLKSSGEKAFCAGASFTELSRIKNAIQGEAFFTGFANVINSLRKCPKFIVARVQGKAVGGGVGLIAASDYAVAITGSDIKLSELEIGIGPFVVGPAIERKIGLSAFSNLTIDAGSWRTAEWAKNRGLFAEVYSTIPEMDESLQRLTEHLSHSNPFAIREIKKMLWVGTADWDQLLAERAKISGQLIVTPLSQQAISLYHKA